MEQKRNTNTHTKWMRRLFDRIAPEYDLLNRINSFCLDIFWRKELIKHVKREQPSQILDLATGTGDLSIAMARAMPSSEVLGTDISLGMLGIADRKAKRSKVSNLKLTIADAMNLPFEAESFDVVTCAFGVRNFPSIPDSYKEIFRVLKPNGMVAVLELCEPENALLKKGYHWHTHSTIPLMSLIFGGNRDAYAYLIRSIKAVPQRAEMQRLMEDAGFKRAYYSVFIPGVCTLYVAYKPTEADRKLSEIKQQWEERTDLDS